jgi:hypothetical protein
MFTLIIWHCREVTHAAQSRLNALRDLRGFA